MRTFWLFFLFSSALATEDLPKGRVIGGNEATIEEFPFLVSVRYYDFHICGGIILNEKRILTSGQCFNGMDQKDMAEITVRVGSTRHMNGEEFSLILPPDKGSYKMLYIDPDAWILKLRQPLTFNEKIQPAQLWTESPDVPPGTVGYVLGWGVTNQEDEHVSDEIRKIQVKVISDMDCNFAYGAGMISYFMMCTEISKDRSWGRGDIGGPLVIDGKVAGIVSWKYEEDDDWAFTPPAVYTKIVSLIDWITKHM